jgi:hypothetical protein
MCFESAFLSSVQSVQRRPTVAGVCLGVSYRGTRLVLNAHVGVGLAGFLDADLVHVCTSTYSTRSACLRGKSCCAAGVSPRPSTFLRLGCQPGCLTALVMIKLAGMALLYIHTHMSM